MRYFLIYVLISVFILGMQTGSNAQTDRAWWESLSPAWKKVIQKQHFKGKDVNPTDEQLEEIGKMVFLDIEGNKDIKSLKPAVALQLLEIIKANGSGIESLDGIEGLMNLKEVDCSDNDNINSLIPLSNLNNLVEVNCGNTMVKSLVPLRHLQKLRKLDVHYTTVVNLSILTTLKSLTYLDVSENISLYSLDGVNYMHELQYLDCSKTNIDDLSPLSKLKMITKLDCSDTKVASLRPIQLVKSLQDIDCSNTNIKAKSLDYLLGHSNLTMLRAKNIEITDQEIKEFEMLLQKRNPNATIIILPKSN
jgi:Leucine-rich repeat (LRR) protein